MFNIAIDGPSGAGKSTIAKLLAKKYNIAYLDTGAMYRGLAYFVLSKSIEVSDVPKVLNILLDITMDIVCGETQKVIVCGQDVTPYIRENHISMAASNISKIPEVRIKLVELQRKIAKSTDCVLDGRDIGTFVLPDADIKIFLTATVEERAKRRYEELKQKNSDVTYGDILIDVTARDFQDTTRAFAPLKAADDAIIVNSTDMDIIQSVDFIDNIIKAKNIF